MRSALVIGQGVRLTVSGVAIGIVVPLVGTRLVASTLFGVTAHDPATFLFVTVAVLVTAAGAAWLPARRATNLAPVEAVRE